MTTEIIIGIVTFTAGVIISHFWRRLTNRLSILRYSVWHQYIGLSAEDALFGSVKISYNDVPVKILYISTVSITNDSSRDLSNLELNIHCDESSYIIISHARNRSSLNNLDFTQKYSNLLAENNPELVGYLSGRRDYFVPVLNRGDSIDVSMLITNFKALQPVITVAADYPGVNVKFQKEPQQKLFGESQGLSALLGLIITAFVCYLLIQHQVSLTPAVWYAWLLGGIAATIGVFAIKFLKLIRKLFH